MRDNCNGFFPVHGQNGVVHVTPPWVLNVLGSILSIAGTCYGGVSALAPNPILYEFRIILSFTLIDDKKKVNISVTPTMGTT
jgi:hypothetical protein